MTANSTQFITPLTLQSLSKRPIHVDVMQERQPDRINHIELAKQADLFLIAPASANLIGKLAHGLADDLISTVALALTAEVPKTDCTSDEYQYVSKSNRATKSSHFERGRLSRDRSSRSLVGLRGFRPRRAGDRGSDR